MPDDLIPQTRFAADCATLTRMLRAQANGEDLDSAGEQALASALSSVNATLPRLLARRVRDVGQDPEDVAQEALERFLKAVNGGRVDPDHSPAGYLLTIAMNVARDAGRAPGADPLEDMAPADGTQVDQVTRMLDAVASADAVRRALARAHARGDHTVLDVVSTWLDLAYQTGKEPASREVALAVGISKTTVANALARFQGFLQDQADSE